MKSRKVRVVVELPESVLRAIKALARQEQGRQPVQPAKQATDEVAEGDVEYIEVLGEKVTQSN